MSIMSLNNCFCNSKSYSCASCLPVTRLVRPVKSFKNERQVLLRYACPLSFTLISSTSPLLLALISTLPPSCVYFKALDRRFIIPDSFYPYRQKFPQSHLQSNFNSVIFKFGLKIAYDSAYQCDMSNTVLSNTNLHFRILPAFQVSTILFILIISS